ncbi:MAG: glycosyltransferase family 2 protein [Dissulfurispiraceae bacterium]|jgi:glycosyltransferase involved in cell wall biosynthesis|nr:glycosyltransferase family 2 protein [Dissulfurispiraceae bacterium]
MKYPELSIIMPAYNEGRVICDNLLEVDKVIGKDISDFEIVVVDDGSTDNTYEQAAQAAAGHGRIRLVRLNRNCGKGEAFKAGFSASSGAFVALLDADLDLPPGQLVPMLCRLKNENADIIIGSKYHPDARIRYPFTRKLMSRCYALLNRTLFGLSLSDTQSGIKIFKREVLDAVLPLVKTSGYAFDIEILTTAFEKNALIMEHPVVLEYRSKKHSPMPLKMAKDLLADTLRVWYSRKIN